MATHARTNASVTSPRDCDRADIPVLKIFFFSLPTANHEEGILARLLKMGVGVGEKGRERGRKKSERERKEKTTPALLRSPGCSEPKRECGVKTLVVAELSSG